MARATVRRHTCFSMIVTQAPRGTPTKPQTSLRRASSYDGGVSAVDPRDQQRELYGAPLGEIARDLMGRLGLTQSRLAAALGLSAPMLSQLVSGQRVKIGNPAVLQRLQRLIELSNEAPDLDPDAVTARIETIRDEQTTLTGASHDESAALRSLAATATADQLAQTARGAESAGASALAALLTRAAGVARG